MRIEPLRQPPIALAHHGASATEPAASSAAFSLALRLGASGHHSGLFMSADGVPVVAADGTVRAGLRRRRLAATPVAALPADRTTPLAEVGGSLGPGHHLVLEVGDADAVAPAVEVAMGWSASLWLASDDLDGLVAWRERWPDQRLVNATTLASLTAGPERRAARLAELAIDAVMLPYADWTGGLVTLFHRFEVEAFGWNAPHSRMLDDLVRMGCDAVSSAHVDRLTDAFTRAGIA